MAIKSVGTQVFFTYVRVTGCCCCRSRSHSLHCHDGYKGTGRAKFANSISEVMPIPFPGGHEIEARRNPFLRTFVATTAMKDNGNAAPSFKFQVQSKQRAVFFLFKFYTADYQMGASVYCGILLGLGSSVISRLQNRSTATIEPLRPHWLKEAPFFRL